jgi:glutathione S-transferase
MMKLHTFPPSPNSRKVIALAEHLGIPLEIVPIDLLKGEQRDPKFLAINPNGMIPTLVDGDFVLWESNAIMQYVADKKPGNTLWPADARSRADIARWLFWEQGHWMQACMILLWENLVKGFFNLGGPDPAMVTVGEEKFAKFAAVLESRLATNDHLACDRLTLADFAVAPYLGYAEVARLPIGRYAAINRWLARLESIPAWHRTTPAMSRAA